MTLTCEGCSYPVEEYADETERVGKCCHNLASPWHMTREGLYVGTTPPGEEPEDHDEDTSEPECASCGRTEFEARCTETVWRGVYDSGGTLFVGDSFDNDVTETRIVCETCGERYHGAWEYE